ncbi:MAG: 28S ribosomal protein S14, mitochondrial [Marteilia pararefringens]
MCLNSIRKSTFMPETMKYDCDKKIVELPLDSCPARLHARCTVTSRSRGHLRPWRVSRIIFKSYADYNQLSGVIRAKWG